MEIGLAPAVGARTVTGDLCRSGPAAVHESDGVAGPGPHLAERGRGNPRFPHPEDVAFLRVPDDSDYLPAVEVTVADVDGVPAGFLRTRRQLPRDALVVDTRIADAESAPRCSTARSRIIRTWYWTSTNRIVRPSVSTNATASSRSAARRPTRRSPVPDPAHGAFHLLTRATVTPDLSASSARWTHDDRDQHRVRRRSPRRAERLLRDLAGPDALLREDQWTAIEALVVGRRRALVVQRTGWGKSAVYFTRREAAAGTRARPDRHRLPAAGPDAQPGRLSLAERAGCSGGDDQLGQRHRVGRDPRTGGRPDIELDVALVSPERLNTPDFPDQVLPSLAADAGLSWVDEALRLGLGPTTSAGHYRRIRTLVEELGEGIPVLATTATANDRVVTDVAAQLGVGGAETLVLRGTLERDSLRMSVVRIPEATQRAAWLPSTSTSSRSGIIYTLTVSAARDLASLLPTAVTRSPRTPGRPTPRRAGGARERPAEHRVKALVRDVGVGHGIRQARSGFVVHLGAPSSPISYYQQGPSRAFHRQRRGWCCCPGTRTSRSGATSHRCRSRVEHIVRKVIDVLDTDRPQSTMALEPLVELNRTRLDLVLKVLDVDGAVRRVRGGWWPRAALDVRRRTLRTTGRRPAGRAASDARVRAHRRVPHDVPARDSSTIRDWPRPVTAAVATTVPVRSYSPDVSDTTLADTRSVCSAPASTSRRASSGPPGWPSSESTCPARSPTARSRAAYSADCPTWMGSAPARPVGRPGRAGTGRDRRRHASRSSRLGLGRTSGRGDGSGIVDASDPGAVAHHATGRGGQTRGSGCAARAARSCAGLGGQFGVPCRGTRRTVGGPGPVRCRPPVLLLDTVTGHGWTLTMAARTLRRQVPPPSFLSRSRPQVIPS